MKIIDDACVDCDYYSRFYGCMNHDCPIYQEYEQSRDEMFNEDIMAERRQMWKNRGKDE